MIPISSPCWQRSWHALAGVLRVAAYLFSRSDPEEAAMHHPIYIVDRQGRYRRVYYLQAQESRLAEPLEAVLGGPSHPSSNQPGSERASRHREFSRGR